MGRSVTAPLVTVRCLCVLPQRSISRRSPQDSTTPAGLRRPARPTAGVPTSTGSWATGPLPTARTPWPSLVASRWGAPLGPAPGGGVLPNRLRPTALSGPGFTEVSAGYEIACALTVGGTQYCWGLFPPGVDFADSTVASTAVPAPVGGGVTLRSISAGHKHACGVAADGRAYCWGRNQTGQVGDSGRSYASDPVAVAGAHIFVSVSAHSPSHSCGVTDARSAYCWGANHLGQLGNGSDSTGLVPKHVAGPHAFTDVSTGFYHSCGLTSDGRVYCWGYGGFGQLGGGTLTDAREPQAVRWN